MNERITTVFVEQPLAKPIGLLKIERANAISISGVDANMT